MLNWPVVTVIVNTHKRPHLLPRALQSVLNQTFDDFEVILVHDGPPDDATMDVARLYNGAFEDHNITFTCCNTEEESGYQCVPKNVGIHQARGDYIAFLDDDNEWTVDHLALLVNAIEEGTVWPDLVYGRRRYVVDKGSSKFKGQTELKEGDSPFVEWNEDAARRLSTSAAFNFIDTSDFIVTRGGLWLLQQNTGMMWNESLRRFADYELVCRGVFYGGWRPKGIDNIVQIYHWHGDNLQLVRPSSEVPRQVDISDVVGAQ